MFLVFNVLDFCNDDDGDSPCLKDYCHSDGNKLMFFKSSLAPVPIILSTVKNVFDVIQTKTHTRYVHL